MSYKWSERVNWHFLQGEGWGGDSPDILIPNVFLDYSESICCRKKPKTVLETRVKCLKKNSYEEPHQTPLTVQKVDFREE